MYAWLAGIRKCSKRLNIHNTQNRDFVVVLYTRYTKKFRICAEDEHEKIKQEASSPTVVCDKPVQYPTWENYGEWKQKKNKNASGR